MALDAPDAALMSAAPPLPPCPPCRSYITLLGAPPLPVGGLLGQTFTPAAARAAVAAARPAGAGAASAANAAQPSPTASLVFGPQV